MGETTLYIGTHDGVCTVTRSNGSWMRGSVTSLSHAAARLALGPGRAYLAAYESGVWRSDDGGRTWACLDSYPSSYAHSVTVHPQDPDLLYVGSEPAALFRSGDGGRSWEECGGFRDHAGAQDWHFHGGRQAHVRDLHFAQRDPDRLYAGIEVGGVIRSLDGGGTWQQLGGTHPDVHSLHICSGRPETVYAATAGGSYRSDDAGETWNALLEGLERQYTVPISASPNDPDTVLVAVATGPQRKGAQAYRSVDGGRSWRRLPLGSDDDMVVAYAWDPANSGSVYAGTDSGVLYTSPDSGESWEQLDVDLPAMAVGALQVAPAA